MFSELSHATRPAFVLLIALTLLTGVAYPLAVSGIAAAVFPSQAGGSLIVQDGRVVGSRHIGQPFEGQRYFWGRPSATGPFPYNAGASSGSNLGPTNPTLVETVQSRARVLRAAHPTQSTIPIDLVTASASGLDPHISPAAANYQVERVAASRGFSKNRVAGLVDQLSEPRTLGVLGEVRVNVLLLNLALDRMERHEL